ncbi:MAG: PEP-CTERM sorting domain-containing protein [Cyanobacteria bacterium P01_H01_bin.26]
MNRVCWIAVAAAALVLSEARVSVAQTVTYDFTVSLTSGPLAGERYPGTTSIELGLLGSPDETVPPLSLLFEFGGTAFTEVDDSQDPDANSPGANFQNGGFVGSTYIVSRFGDNPVDIPPVDSAVVDGFAISNGDFGYIVGPNLYTGGVSYTVSAHPAESVPEPSGWLGLALGYGGWLVWRRSA